MSAGRRFLQSNGVLFVLLAAFWGTSFVAIEVGLEHVPPVLFAALRYDVAGLVVLAYAIATADRWLPRGRTEWMAIFVGGVLLIAAFHAFVYLGEGHVPGAIAAIVVSLAPVLTAVLDHLFLGESRIDPVGVAGLCFGLFGVAVVANPTPGSVASTNLVGIGLVFLGTASFALGGVATRPLRTDLPVVSLQAWTMLVGAGVLHLGSAARGESFAAASWTSTALASLVYLTLVSGVVGFLLYFELLDRLGPSELNLVSYLEPVAAALVSWVVLGHVLAPTAAAGFVAIFVGFVFLQRETLTTVLTTHTSVGNDPA